MARIISAAAFALLTVLFRCLPALAAQLEDIRFEAVSANEERVHFRLSQPVEPHSFPMKDGSPRMVFDFSGTSVSKRIKNSLETKGALIQRVRVGLHENKTRVVLDLVQGRQVKSFKEGGSILTVVVHDACVQPEPRKAAAAPPPAAAIWSPTAEKAPEIKPPVVRQTTSLPQAKEQPPQAKPSAGAPPDTVLSTVIFDKNSNRGEMVMFRLNKFHPPVVFGLEEKKPRVVCDFQGTAAGERLPESIPADGKHVRGIRIERDEAGRKIRVVLDLAPNSSYDLQQVFFKNDNLFVLIINTLGNTAKPLR
ncbi:MAG: AMIN domain-containing protein [Candidatus Electronema sp. V4]|uniref:AMIN domain-containing protein n=1 Tax=Candidatus Electronema sp. V4 TaxID=3454756 RepID=UPI0040558340